MVKIDTAQVRVYIEGVLFPYVKTVQVSESAQGVNCQLEVPPSFKFRPEEWKGAMCHIYYANARVLDLWGGSMYGPPINEGWPILFQGELSGDQENHGVQSETAMLSFVSHKRHFDQTLLYFYDPLNKSTNSAIAAHDEAWFVGNTVINLDTDGILSKENQLLSVLNARMEDVLEGEEGRNIAFSSLALEVLRSAKDQHVLFGYFDNKLKLSQRFAAYSDPDVQNILKLTTFKNLMDARVSKLPPYTSLMQVLEVMTDMMQYNWLHFAQPKLRTGALDAAEERFGVSLKEVNSLIKKVTAEIANGNTDTILGQFTLPTAVERLSLKEFESKVLERIYDNIPNSENLTLLVRNGFIGTLADNFLPIREDSIAGKALGVLEDFNVLAAPDESVEKEKQAKKALFADQKDLEFRDEINEFTIVPKLEFSHPPRCNVFMPSSMTNYGIARDYLQELTRLFARVQLSPAQSGTSEPIIEWYIAPIAQSYHLLQDDYLNGFTDEYNNFMKNNEVIEDVEDEN